MKDSLLTVREVADQLRVHPMTVRRWIQAGTLRAVKVGRAYRVTEADVASLLASDEEAS